jgi:Tol biopolymer transport system component
MGEVYRARDVKLHREVAVKVLPALFHADAERVARFEREARTLASLNHPGIANIYGLEELDGTHALVMELVPGEDLSQRLARGPLPVDEALAIARQIADALEAAHDQGIVHRDLKPANIKLRPDGTVKVLDFGLAKARDQASGFGPQASGGVDPTVTSPAMTAAGVILGTAAYMSPEQARGRVVDKRADIWAFGCVLFEMLSGRRAFEGSDLAETIGAVIHKTPPWEALPPTPPGVQPALARCLEKDPKLRARDIGDVRLALGGAFATSADAPAATPRPRRSIAGLALAALAGAIVVAPIVWFARRPAPEPQAPIQFSFTAPGTVRLSSFFSISPDGMTMVFQANEPLGALATWTHSFATGQTRLVEGVERTFSSQIWAPDSRAFAYASGGQLKRVKLDGGPPEMISPVPGSFAGGSWAPDGTVIFGLTRGPLLRVTGTSTAPVPITTLDPARQEFSHSNPWFLPDGRHFIYLRASRVSDLSGVYVGSLDDPPDGPAGTRLVASSASPVFAATPGATSGHLLFARDGSLMAQAFDLRSLRLTGEPALIARGVATQPANYLQAGASANGRIVYRRPDAFAGGTPTWFDRDGNEKEAIPGFEDKIAAHPNLSPDGHRLAVIIERDLWVYDLTGRPPIRLTRVNEALYSPLWSRDGSTIVFELGGSAGLRRLPSDGRTTTPQPLGPVGHYHAHGWSADGNELVMAGLDPQINRWRIFRMPLAGTPQPEPLFEPPGPAESSSASPGDGFYGVSITHDGRWLAYVSDVTGLSEVWVRPYGRPGAPVRISAHGGAEPLWARNGRELYFWEGNKLMVAAVTTSGETFDFKLPRPMFELHFPRVNAQPPTYDVAADGRFLLLKVIPLPPPPIEVILNWTSLAR